MKIRKERPEDILAKLDPMDDDDWWFVMDLQDEINRRNRMKIAKRYGNHVVAQVEKEFGSLRFWYNEISCIPPKKIFGEHPKLYKGEDCPKLKFYSDCHTDICGDGWIGDVYIKTKKGFFSIHVQD